MLTTSLQAALDWLDLNAVEGGKYTITLNADESIAPKELSYSRKTVSISIIGGDMEQVSGGSQIPAIYSSFSMTCIWERNPLSYQRRLPSQALR
jgi:hypothetical protein